MPPTHLHHTHSRRRRGRWRRAAAGGAMEEEEEERRATGQTPHGNRAAWKAAYRLNMFLHRRAAPRARCNAQTLSAASIPSYSPPSTSPASLRAALSACALPVPAYRGAAVTGGDAGGDIASGVYGTEWIEQNAHGACLHARWHPLPHCRDTPFSSAFFSSAFCARSCFCTRGARARGCNLLLPCGLRRAGTDTTCLDCWHVLSASTSNGLTMV